MPGRKKGLLHSLTGRGADDEIMIGQRYRKQGVAWVIWEVNYEIRQGTLAFRLLRPVHPLVAYACENVAAPTVASIVAR